jgi:hypothetical protein
MRHIRTFLLRLYVDPDVPDRLCGDLRPLETREVCPFKDETGLVKLLQKLSVPSKDGGPISPVNSLPNEDI